MNVLAVRLTLDAVRDCLLETQADWCLLAAHQIHKLCARVVRGDIDFVVANGDLPSWDLHVLREHTDRQATELLVLRGTSLPDDLGRRLEDARLRRAQYLRRLRSQPARR